MKFTFLLTDKCFLLLLVIVVITLLFSLRRQPTRLAFIQMFQKPVTVCAFVIFMLFLVISILDSIHILNSQTHQSQTVLDALLSPMDKTMETTYSAPLSLYQFVSDTVILNEQAIQMHPRLKQSLSRFKNETDVYHFIHSSIIDAFIVMILSMCFGILALIIFQKIRHQCVNILKISSAQLCFIFTISVVIFLVMASYTLSRELHLLGTGKIGQDIFYFSLKSIRTGIVIGSITTLCMLPLALGFGIIAGYFGGIIDDIIQYIYTTLSSIPGVLLITAAILSMQTYIANHPFVFSTLAERADARLFALCIILGVTSWTGLCRLLRAETLKIKQLDFIIAAKAMGSHFFYIFFKHLLPNVLPIILITVVLDFSFLVLAEAVLSYVGVGVSPLTISWGNMINGARMELAREPMVWWPILAAFSFMFILVLVSNIVADALRDAFDPNQATL